MIWHQNYDPLHILMLSTLRAFLSAALLLGFLGLLRLKAHLVGLVGMGMAYLR